MMKDRNFSRENQEKWNGQPQKTLEELIGSPVPQDGHAEKAIMGSFLNDNKIIKEWLGIIEPDDFYSTANSKIWRAMIDLSRRGVPVDVVTLHDELQRRGELDAVGGAHYLTELPMRAPSTQNVHFHIKIVLEKSRKRRWSEYGIRLIEMATNGTGDEELQKVISELQTARLDLSVANCFVVAQPPDSVELEEIVPEMIYAGCVTTIGGHSGAAKSLYLQHILNRSGFPSLYIVNLDHDSWTFYHRQQYMAGNAVLPIELNPDGDVVADLKSEKFWRALEMTVRFHHARVVVFDTILDFVEGNYNQAGEMNKPLQRLRRFARANNVAVILVTHLSKKTGEKDDITLLDFADSRIFATKADLALAFQFREKPDTARWFLRIINVKNRYGKKGTKTVYRFYSPDDTPQKTYLFERTEEEFPKPPGEGSREVHDDGVLEILNETGLKAGDIAQRLQIGRATAFRCLKNLKNKGLAQNKGGLWFSQS